MSRPGWGTCYECYGSAPVKRDGTLYRHFRPMWGMPMWREACTGSGKPFRVGITSWIVHEANLTRARGTALLVGHKHLYPFWMPPLTKPEPRPTGRTGRPLVPCERCGGPRTAQDRSYAWRNEWGPRRFLALCEACKSTIREAIDEDGWIPKGVVMMVKA